MGWTGVTVGALNNICWRKRPAVSASTATDKRARSTPFLRSSGLPFFTVAITMLPQVAPGILLSRPLMPLTEMMYKFLAPVLSAQFITEPTHRPRVVRNLLPIDPARPVQGIRDRQTEPAAQGHQAQVMARTALRHGGGLREKRACKEQQWAGARRHRLLDAAGFSDSLGQLRASCTMAARMPARASRNPLYNSEKKT